MSTASSASRTNIARRSTAVYSAIVRSGGRPSAFHSRTALISRIAGSPRLTIASRPNGRPAPASPAPTSAPEFIAVPARVIVVPARPHPPRRPPGAPGPPAFPASRHVPAHECAFPYARVGTSWRANATSGALDVAPPVAPDVTFARHGVPTRAPPRTDSRATAYRLARHGVPTRGDARAGW